MAITFEKPLLHAISYFLLTVAAFWSFVTIYLTCKTLTTGTICFVLFFTTGFFGTWLYTCIKFQKLSCLNEKVIKAFEYSKFMMNLYTLPILLTDFYFKNNFSTELIVSHLTLPILALVPKQNGPKIKDRTILSLNKHNYFSKKRNVTETVDFVMFVTAISLSIVATLYNSLFGVLASLVYAYMYFLVTDRGHVRIKWYIRLPVEPIFVMGMAMFCLLAMKSISSVNENCELCSIDGAWQYLYNKVF